MRLSTHVFYVTPETTRGKVECIVQEHSRGDHMVRYFSITQTHRSNKHVFINRSKRVQ